MQESSRRAEMPKYEALALRWASTDPLAVRAWVAWKHLTDFTLRAGEAPAPAGQWDSSDDGAMRAVVELEEAYHPLVTPEIALAPLPYNEGELRMLRRHLAPRPPGELFASHADGLAAAECDIFVGGLRHLVRGRDLMRRWWLWRRSQEDFADGESLDAAQQALGEVQELLHHTSLTMDERYGHDDGPKRPPLPPLPQSFDDVVDVTSFPSYRPDPPLPPASSRG
jgi:hypothetical protein